MSQVIPKRMTAEIDGDFVVFLIGMRINKPWKIHKWLPVFLAMPPMLKELEKHPESGFLGHIQSLGVIVQYWRSFEQLEATRAIATSGTGPHGWHSTSGPATTARMSASGTRRIVFVLVRTTRLSTAVCLPSVSVRPARSYLRRGRANRPAVG